MNDSTVRGRPIYTPLRARKTLIRRVLIVAGLLAAVALVLAVLPQALGTDSLRRIDSSEPGVVNFANDSGEHTGTFFTRFLTPNNTAPELTVQIPSEDGYEIDSVLMRFESLGHVPVRLQASTYDVEYRWATHGLDTVLEIRDTGFYGEGTMTFRFTLGDTGAVEPFLLSFDVLRHSTTYPYQKQQMKSSLQLNVGE